jgi:hypothetical protein
MLVAQLTEPAGESGVQAVCPRGAEDVAVRRPGPAWPVAVDFLELAVVGAVGEGVVLVRAPTSNLAAAVAVLVAELVMRRGRQLGSRALLAAAVRARSPD